MTTLTMPKADEAVLARRGQIAADLREIVGEEWVVDHPDGLRPFESDGLTAYRTLPLVVVLPETTDEVVAVLRYCDANGLKVVPRGSGTSLSGGSMPVADAVLLVMSRFNRILDVDFENRVAVVQPGVTNLNITKAVAHRGFYYAPDPSSQIACSIGGNVAENSGGVHCLKYGITTNNVLGIEMALMSGELVRLGGSHLDAEGYDLLALMTGSEGLLGVVTEVTVRILQSPETARAVLLGFPSSEDGGQCVAEIIAAGIIPGGMEMMDRPAIHAAEDYVHAGYPLDVEALLIVELDGPQGEVDFLLGRVEAIGRANRASYVRVSQSEAERQAFWLGRKAAFPAVGRISPDYYCMDGTIPRKALPQVLQRMRELSEQYGLLVANVFHAGDGNLHPLLVYDKREPGAVERVHQAGIEIVTVSVQAGGVLSGEHGIGLEKRDLMPMLFTPVDLAAQAALRRAFDPRGLANPHKVLPSPASCGDVQHVPEGAWI